MANSPFCYKTHKQCFWLRMIRERETGGKRKLKTEGSGGCGRQDGGRREEVGKVGRVAVNNDTRCSFFATCLANAHFMHPSQDTKSD